MPRDPISYRLQTDWRTTGELVALAAYQYHLQTCPTCRASIEADCARAAGEVEPKWLSDEEWEKVKP